MMQKEHVLVIGGTKGIGKALVRLLSSERKVSVISREKPASSEKNVSYWQCDILDKKKTSATIRSVIAKNGKLNGLIFSQRYRGKGEDWSGEIAISITATREIIEQLSNSFAGNASIVLISSVNASLISGHLSAGYHVAKAGVVQMARYFAVKLGPKGIRVNSISPGTVLKDESREFLLKNKKLVDFYRNKSPLGRMGTADEVAKTAVFLSGNDSSFITGQNIVVDGGVSVQWAEALDLNLD